MCRPARNTTTWARKLTNASSVIAAEGPPANPANPPFTFVGIIIFLLAQVVNAVVILLFGSAVTPREEKKVPRGSTRSTVQSEPPAPVAGPAPLPRVYNLPLVLWTVFLVLFFTSISFLAWSITRVLVTFDSAAKASVDVVPDVQLDSGAAVPFASVGACTLMRAMINLFYSAFLSRVDECKMSTLFASLYDKL
ncbi:hypothetical protein BDV93DRAFT_549668 [Ceratobasidium sp. AG-I]|nr:hypothetical protein BDV93DRAFT_549668 [Ceratobasidium sp. AG-I]